MAFLLTYVLFLVACNNTNSSEPSALPVSEVLRQADAQQIANLFPHVVELNFDGKSNDYSRVQAKLILKSFFQQYPPKGFRVLQEGKDNRGQQFIIGEYQSEEQQYRIYTALSQKEGKSYLNHLSINRL